MLRLVAVCAAGLAAQAWTSDHRKPTIKSRAATTKSHAPRLPREGSTGRAGEAGQRVTGQRMRAQDGPGANRIFAQNACGQLARGLRITLRAWLGAPAASAAAPLTRNSSR